MRQACIILLTILLIPLCDVWGQETSQQSYSDLDRIQVIEHGLKYLKARQKSDGSFGDGYYEGDAAVTALAGMAFMSSGDVGDSDNSSTAKCVDYLLSIARPDGFINRPATADADGSFRPMYGHGFATLFLAEMAGMYKEDELIPKLDKAIQLIIASQNDEGGWRYFPIKKDADVSVTACQVIALRAARNAGRDVPAQVIDKAVKYLLDRQNSDGGFMYMSPSGDSALPRTVAVVVALYCAGLTNDNPAIKKAWEYGLVKSEEGGVRRELGVRSEEGGVYAKRSSELENGKVFTQSCGSTSTPHSSLLTLHSIPTPHSSLLTPHYTTYPYYTAYYLSGCSCFIEKSESQKVRDNIIQYLISSQNPDGSWSSEFSKDYATAMALIVLQLDNNYLPVWQR